MEEVAAALNPLHIGAERPDLLPTYEADDVLRVRFDPPPTPFADVDDALVAHLSSHVTDRQAEAARPRAAGKGTTAGAAAQPRFRRYAASQETRMVAGQLANRPGARSECDVAETASAADLVEGGCRSRSQVPTTPFQRVRGVAV
jgi:hypothetical protein